MAILLNIHTAEEVASLCISRDAQPVSTIVNDNQKDHAAWLHAAIQGLLKDNGMEVRDLQGVAVSIGPGSYTGLRVGLSAAKGLCYSLNIPLITIGTLKLMAYGATEKNKDADLICPMIDARRMEVYTALYDRHLTEIRTPVAVVIDENSFVDLISSNKVVFCGSGSKKLQKKKFHRNVIFDAEPVTAASMAHFSHTLYKEKTFVSVAYTEPLYIKEFYSPYRRHSA